MRPTERSRQSHSMNFSSERTRLAHHPRDGVAVIDGDAEVFEALHDVAFETAGIRHELDDSLDVRALKGHPARHDETDVSAAEDDDAFAHEIALDVAHLLRHARRVYARGTGARKRDRARRAFSASHREHHRARMKMHQPLLGRERDHFAVTPDRERHRAEHDLDVRLRKFLFKTVGVFGARQLLAEIVQPETRVYALIEYAAETHIALQEQDARALFACGDRRRHTGGSAAYHQHVKPLHSPPPSRQARLSRSVPRPFLSRAWGRRVPRR